MALNLPYDYNFSVYRGLFIRWKIRDEFEIRFEPPVTGVSSGRATVGAHVIIDTDNTDHFRKYNVPTEIISGRNESVHHDF